MSVLDKLTWRQQCAVDLLSLHVEHEAISELLASGTPLHTVLNLYAFDIKDYAAGLIHRVENNANFRILSGSLLARQNKFDDAASLRNSPTHLKVEVDYLAWTREREGSYAKLSATMTSRLLIQYASTNATSGYAKANSEKFCEMIYKSLAFASWGVAEPSLFLSPNLKDTMSHVLIYLCSPEIYGRWGAKHLR